MTLNVVMAVTLRYFTNFGSLEANYKEYLTVTNFKIPVSLQIKNWIFFVYRMLFYAIIYRSY